MLTSLHLHMKSNEVCINTRSPPASLPLQGEVTKHTFVKWAIDNSSLFLNLFQGPLARSDTAEKDPSFRTQELVPY